MRKIILMVAVCSSAVCGAAFADVTSAQAENLLIVQAQKAEAAKDWPGAEAAFKQLTAMDPGRWQYSQGLGNAEFREGKYEEAVHAYAAALGIAVKDKLKETRQAMAEMYVNQGNAYLKLHQEDQALAAYSKGAALSGNPAKAYFNLCAVYYNMGKTDQALGACDKAIAADPNKADAYFIKGSVLMADAKIDANGKATYPAGTAEALQMYMKLAPTGSHADDVKQMLDYIGKP